MPKFELCLEETGSTNQKKLNIQTFPRTHTFRTHQRFCLWICHRGGAYLDYKHRVSSSVFQRSPIIIVVGQEAMENFVFPDKCSFFNAILTLMPSKSMPGCPSCLRCFFPEGKAFIKKVKCVVTPI